MGISLSAGVLANRSFAALVASQTISNVGTWVNYAATAWAVYDLTNSPVQVGLVVLARTIPFILLSLIGGSFADRLDRRLLLLVSQSALAVLSAILAIAFMLGRPPVELIYLVSIGVAIASAFDLPAMNATIPALVPRSDLVSAISLMTFTRHIGSVSGPALAGILIARFGVGAAFAFDALSFLAVLVTLALIRWPSVPAGKRAPVLQSIADGLRFARSSPIILSLLALDLTATFFAQPNALLPVIARDVLGLGAEGYGVLGAAFSTGAIAGSILLTLLRGRIPAAVNSIVAATMLYGLGSVFLGLSPTFALAFVSLVIMGIGDVISETLRQSLLQLTTPDEYRGRLSSVNMIFVRGGPSFGQFRAGTVAGLYGPSVAALSGGLLCLAGALAVGSWANRRLRTHPSETVATSPGA